MPCGNFGAMAGRWVRTHGDAFAAGTCCTLSSAGVDFFVLQLVDFLLVVLRLTLGSQCETVSSISFSDNFLPILYFTLRNKFISVGVSTEKHVPSDVARMITDGRCCCNAWMPDVSNESVLLAWLCSDSASENEAVAFESSDGGGEQTIDGLNWSRAHNRLRGGKSDSSSESDGFGVINPLDDACDAKISEKLRFKLFTSSICTRKGNKTKKNRR